MALDGIGAITILPIGWRVTTDPHTQNQVAIVFMGFALVAQQVIFLVFGGTTIPLAPLASGTVLLPGGAFFTYQQLISALVAVTVYGFLYLFMFRTKMGRATRAFSQDRETAEAMGVKVRRMVMTVFGRGTSLGSIS